MHSQNNDNDHIPVAIVGWCQNVKRGPHILSVYITRNGGNADCYTGWANQDYTTTVAAFVKNATDERYLPGAASVGSSLGTFFSFYGEPRTYGLEFRYEY